MPLPQSEPVRRGEALWFLLVLLIPLIGVLVYLIARGGSMSEQAAGRAQRQDPQCRR